MFNTGGGVYWHSPTKTYQGSLSESFYGVYRYVSAVPLCSQTFPPCIHPDEVVFYLETDTGLLVRLIFLCGFENCYRTSQLPFSNGTRVYVKGTLIEPSEWPPLDYEPRLYFAGDLYVLEYSVA